MARALVIEEESGTYTGRRHPHNGYYAGDFSVSRSATVEAALSASSRHLYVVPGFVRPVRDADRWPGPVPGQVTGLEPPEPPAPIVHRRRRRALASDRGKHSRRPPATTRPKSSQQRHPRSGGAVAAGPGRRSGSRSSWPPTPRSPDPRSPTGTPGLRRTRRPRRAPRIVSTGRPAGRPSPVAVRSLACAGGGRRHHDPVQGRRFPGGEGRQHDAVLGGDAVAGGDGDAGGVGDGVHLERAGDVDLADPVGQGHAQRRSEPGDGEVEPDREVADRERLHRDLRRRGGRPARVVHQLADPGWPRGCRRARRPGAGQPGCRRSSPRSS